MKRLAILLAAAILALAAPLAVAAWTSSASGAGSAASTSVAPAIKPTTTRGDGVVTLSWASSTLVSGDPVQGYRVLRHVGSGVATICTVAAPTLSCEDTDPVPDEASYGVVATVGRWAGPESELASITYDNTAPTTTAAVSPAANAAGWHRTAVEVTLTAVDDFDVDSITYTVDDGGPVTVDGGSATFPVSGTGTHSVAYLAVDGAGNTESASTATVKIDPDAPTTTVTPNDPTAWHNDEVTLGFSATDAESGVASITVDGDTTLGDRAEKTISAEGTHTVSFHATDVADNVEGAKSTTVRIDKTAPAATITPASSATWITQATQSVTIDASDSTGPTGANSGVASIAYAVDGAAPVTVSGSSASFSLGQGAHSVSYYATDVAGNVQSSQVSTIKVDNLAPVTAFSQAPNNGAVTLSASDATSGVGTIYYRVGSTGAFTGASGNPATLSLANGTHTLWFYAVDAAGNQEAPQSRSVTIGSADTTAPTTTINELVESGSYTSQNSGTGSWAKVCGDGRICATVTDAGSGVDAATVSYTLTGLSGAQNGKCWSNGSWVTGSSCVGTMTQSGGTWTATHAVSRNGAQGMNAGSYRVLVRATDNAGNQASTTITFTTF